MSTRHTKTTLKVLKKLPCRVGEAGVTHLPKRDANARRQLRYSFKVKI